MGRHLIRALTHDGLDEGSQSTKYTQVALKKGTSLGPSLFTWKRQDKGQHSEVGDTEVHGGMENPVPFPKATVHTLALYHSGQGGLTEKPSLSGSNQPAGCEQSHYHPEAQFTRTGKGPTVLSLSSTLGPGTRPE